MKKTRYSGEQIIGILKEAEAGIPITELCRKYGISDATYYNWKAKYGGMTTSEMRKLRRSSPKKNQAGRNRINKIGLIDIGCAQ